ncbi:FtsX-like permease family protein, partial [Streptomyces kronopolitis]|uniref:FtsX-like permease family protein n=1 Tax=Streptomyces kronopolitis TaxID=1612435 RepID=UPI003448A332
GIAVGLRAVLDANGAGFPDGPVIISPTAVLSSLAVGVLVTALAAWLPSRKAAKIAPVEALNTVEAPPALRSLVLRNTVGTVITAVGVIVMLWVSTKNSNKFLEVAILGSALTLIGITILAPLLSRPLVSLTGLATTRLFGIGGKLAKENTLRNPRRTAATASALMVGLTLITGMTVVGNSAQQAMDKVAAPGVTADYQIQTSTSAGLDPEMSKKVAKIPGVEAVAPLRTASFTTITSGNGSDEAGLGFVTGTDLAKISRVTQLTFTQGSLHAVRASGGIAISQKGAKLHGWHEGDTVSVRFGGKQTRLKIAAVYKDNQALGESIADVSLVDPHLPQVRDEQLLVKAAGGGSPALVKEIQRTLGDSPLLKIQNHDDLRKENAGKIATVVNMVYGLLGTAVIIAVVGVVNTLAMSVFERTREIGMLRAIGLARSGIKQMVQLESVVISLFGAVLGTSVGIFLAWAGGSLVGSSFPTYEMVLPWGRIGLFLLIALVVGVLAALWPARRAAQLNMLEAVGTE